MNIKKIISEEVRKIFKENYPMGAEFDSNAPWNQDDNVRQGQKASESNYDLLWADNEFAFFKGQDGNVYVLYVDAIEKSDLEPFADREEEFLGKDEDGMPEVEYGDWEITDEVLENFVNASDITVGSGIDDYESGEYDLVMLDDRLRKELLSLAKYIKNDRARESFISILSGNVSEGGVTDKIVNQQTMDTPTGTLFVINTRENGLKENNIRRDK